MTHANKPRNKHTSADMRAHTRAHTISPGVYARLRAHLCHTTAPRFLFLTCDVARVTLESGRGYLPLASRGAAGPMAFHASRRACGFYSCSLAFAACWSPQGSDYTGACARSFRMPPSWSKHQRVRSAQMGGVEVSAERHKSDCRSTAGEDQQGLRVCGLEGRRLMQ